MVEFETVGVVGCGLMGHGIAQVAAAQAGRRVVVLESDPAALARGLARIDGSLAKLAEKAVAKGKVSAADAERSAREARARIEGVNELSALARCDLVIEAIVEDLDAKCALFADLDRVCGERAVFASNTSSFPIVAMADASGRPSRMVGLHFFNPVQLMGLVEVVRTQYSDDAVVEAAVAFGRACGKAPVRCKDTPGFVVNRLLVPYLVQALLMLERGDATADDIDRITDAIDKALTKVFA